MGVRNPDPERDETEVERSACMLVSAGLDFGESGGVKKDEDEDEVAIECECFFFIKKVCLSCLSVFLWQVELSKRWRRWKKELARSEWSAAEKQRKRKRCDRRTDTLFFFCGSEHGV